MILEIITKEIFGYNPSILKSKSNKNLFACCDICGSVRILSKEGYRRVCHTCSNELKSETNKNYERIIIEPELLWELHWGLDYSLGYIANLFDCTTGCIKNKMTKHRVPNRNTKESQMLYRGVRRGKKGEFKKGKLSWNKGLRGIHLNPKWEFKRNGRMSGENHWNWKGGITPLDTSIRELISNKQWRTKIFKRDNYTCQECGSRCGNGHRVILCAHHIIPFAKIINDFDITSINDAYNCKELWDISNGITLCVNCHNKVHFNKGLDLYR